MEVELYWAAGLLPDMSRAEYLDLKNDIEANGLNRPVETHEGKLIDGRHRLRACTELGVKPDIIEADVGGSASAQKTALAWAGQGR